MMMKKSELRCRSVLDRDGGARHSDSRRRLFAAGMARRSRHKVRWWRSVVSYDNKQLLVADLRKGLSATTTRFEGDEAVRLLRW